MIAVPEHWNPAILAGIHDGTFFAKLMAVLRTSIGTDDVQNPEFGEISKRSRTNSSLISGPVQCSLYLVVKFDLLVIAVAVAPITVLSTTSNLRSTNSRHVYIWRIVYDTTARANHQSNIRQWNSLDLALFVRSRNGVSITVSLENG